MTYKVHKEVVTNGLGNAELTLTAYDVIIQAKSWESAQNWLDASTKWAEAKKMKWEPTKCATICSKEGLEDD